MPTPGWEAVPLVLENLEKDNIYNKLKVFEGSIWATYLEYFIFNI